MKHMFYTRSHSFDCKRDKILFRSNKIELLMRVISSNTNIDISPIDKIKVIYGARLFICVGSNTDGCSNIL